MVPEGFKSFDILSYEVEHWIFGKMDKRRKKLPAPEAKTEYSYRIQDLEPETTYMIRVADINVHGSNYNEEKGQKTPPAPPGLEAYRQAGPGCGALLTQDIVTKTIIVSRSFNSSFDETHALLNSSNGWCSLSLDPHQHLLIELGKVATITGFDIQGRSSSNQYVTDFLMSYKATKQMLFQDYSRFMASPSSGDEIIRFQVNATDMQVVGFFPIMYKEHICMRVELYGCIPVDGGYTPWSAWNSCSNLCGNGTQHRHRECSNPAPANDGQRCVGNSTETRGCVNTSCPEWSEWTSCSVICGNGSQSRSRNCTNLRPRNGVKSCKAYRTCRLEQCEVDRANSSSSFMEGDQRKDKFFILMVVLAAALPVVIVT